MSNSDDLFLDSVSKYSKKQIYGIDFCMYRVRQSLVYIFFMYMELNTHNFILLLLYYMQITGNKLALPEDCQMYIVL